MVGTGWVVAGGTVAEFDQRHSLINRVAFTTVIRLTATQIVCASGSRYRRDNGTLIGERRVEIRSIGDQQVRSAVAIREMERLRYRLDGMFKNLRGGEPGALAVLDAIEKEISAVRAAIANPAGAKDV